MVKNITQTEKRNIQFYK